MSQLVNTLQPFSYTYVPDVRRRIGRSKKSLKPVVTHDGVVWVARFEGRPEKCFGATKKDAQRNLRGAE